MIAGKYLINLPLGMAIMTSRMAISNDESSFNA
jgi:hypothetical protein